MSHFGFIVYIKKYGKAKEELWKFKHFNMQKYILSKKIPLKETKIPQDIISFITNLQSFNTSQNIIFQKPSYKNRPTNLGGQNPLSY